MLGQAIIPLIWVIGILSALIFGLAFVKVILESYADLRSWLRIVATKRHEVLAGKDYIVTTQTLPLLREKKTGRLALLMERGYRNQPTTRDGRTALEPQWVRVQFLRNSNGRARRFEWRSFEKFDAMGVANVDFMTRRLGFFRTELLMRYSSELDASRPNASPK